MGHLRGILIVNGVAERFIQPVLPLFERFGDKFGECIAEINFSPLL